MGAIAMPLSHTRQFRIRHYECDGYGHLNNVNYLRYMQETAFDASTAAGYGQSRYAAMGRIWLIRANDIEYLSPLRYNDVVEIKTWVVDFRKVTSRRAYEFRRQGSDELVARGYSDWAFLDIRSGEPVPIPNELRTAFFPEGDPGDFPARPRFPEAPPPPPGVFKMQRRVEWRDLDPENHVNNAVYLAYLEDCGFQVAAAYGWNVERMRAAGFAILARRHRIQYRQPARMGDELEIATWVSHMKRASAVRHYTVTRLADQALIARSHSLYAWVDVHSGKPARIPARFLDDFRPNISASY
jgi:acyl-CoA thioester hydrolase